jgi:Mrp family chromosome partitioning ATPase
MEQTVLSIDFAKARIVGFTSAEPNSGNSICAVATATVYARSGRPVLLIDLSQSGRDNPSHGWVAGDSGEGWFPGDIETDRWLIHREQGFDQLTVRPTETNRFLFTDVRRIRAALEEHLKRYSVVLLDLGPLVDDELEEFLSPLAPASACDAVLLICRRGILTRGRLQRAMAVVRSADFAIRGVILNDLTFISVGQEIAAWLGRTLRFMPRFAAKLQRKILASELLTR